MLPLRITWPFLKVLRIGAFVCTASTSRGHEAICNVRGQYFRTVISNGSSKTVFSRI